MKWVIVLCMLGAATAFAHDLIEPDWRGQEGTTYQQWRFDDACNPAIPEVINNPYGQATATITVGEYGEGWLYDLGLGTQTGYWDLGGTGGQIVLEIDNRPEPLPYKEIWVQVTYYVGIIVAPTVDVPEGRLISTQTILVEEDIFGGWFLDQSVWRIGPNPAQEQIIVTADPNWGSVIDQVVVDTNCTSSGCIVDFYELARFCEQWLQTASNSWADFDNSGCVDFKDFSIFANSWLDVCPPW